MPIVHKYRVRCMKNNECVILVQSVIQNRSLYLFSTTVVQQQYSYKTTLSTSLTVIPCKANLIGHSKASR